MLRRNGPVVKSVESVLRLEGSLWGERFVEEVQGIGNICILSDYHSNPCPAHVVQWSNHLGAMCRRAWRSQWPRIDSSLNPGASAY